MKCFILDDQYGKSLYQGLSSKFKKLDFPIKDNVKNPLDFVDKISNDDIVLLDNFFPGETREEPLGAEFLNRLFQKNIYCKIICISDYGKTLIDCFDERENTYKNGSIVGFAPEKTVNSVEKYIK